jgi:uncharacterized protein
MDKLRLLRKKIKAKEKLLVAFSGGVDSSLVAKVAYETLGKNALAITADSCTLPRRELENAKKLAKEIGIRHKVIKFSELRNSKFVKNPPERCYYCREGLIKELKKIARKEKIKTIADGTNLSDFKEHRPGIIASDKLGVWHPLVDASIEKKEVRKFAKLLGLTTYSKPSMACLASRIPYGEKITEKKLRLVEQAEDFIKSLGFEKVRVRLYNSYLARIEVESSKITNFLDSELRNKIISSLKRLGIVYLTLDLEGYRPGSLNEILTIS